MAKLFNLEYKVDIPENFDDTLENKVFVDPEMYEKIILNLCKYFIFFNAFIRVYI